jgi:hypothetical protein
MSEDQGIFYSGEQRRIVIPLDELTPESAEAIREFLRGEIHLIESELQRLNRRWPEQQAIPEASGSSRVQ